MKLTVIRHNLQEDYTSGILLIDGVFECYTLEDEQREVKVWGKTCVPDGEYQITLRKTGGFLPMPTPGGVPVEIMSPG